MSEAKQYICDLTHYEPGKPVNLVAREYGVNPDQIIKLASNENPLGPSPKALEALRVANSEVHRYPEQHELLHALASHLHTEPSALLLGNGSNDVIDLIARTFLGQGDEAISSQYAFAIYRIATQSAGAQNILTTAKVYGHDLAAMHAAISDRTRIIWIANPNNPTGTFIPYSTIKAFLEKVPNHIVVVLDEAYFEYLETPDQANAITWLSDHPNLILMRTFSKIYGLAGLRVGYGITSPETAELLNRVRHPFNVNSLAIHAATAALTDHDFIIESSRQNKKGREQLVQGLQQLHINCLPAYGNFVTIHLEQADEINNALLRQGIIVRPLAAYDMPSFLRVTVGTENENTHFLSALNSILHRSL
jgi:histidinol-phosphate aminotransferase